MDSFSTNNSTKFNLQGKIVTVDQYKGQGLAVVTSGGDAQGNKTLSKFRILGARRSFIILFPLLYPYTTGMNPTLRAIVRTGLFCGCKIYYIKEGYPGLMSGGANIEEATWNSVSSIIHKVGCLLCTWPRFLR